MKFFIEIPAEQVFALFKLAHQIANHPDVTYNDEIQYQAVDLVMSLASYLIDFEKDVLSTSKKLPYQDSILNNPEYEYYCQ